MKNRGKLIIVSLLVVIIVVCGGYMLLRPSSKDVAADKPTKTETLSTSSSKKHHQEAKKNSSSDEADNDSATAGDDNDETANSSAPNSAGTTQLAQNNNNAGTAQTVAANNNQTQNAVPTYHKSNGVSAVKQTNRQKASQKTTSVARTQQPVTVQDGMNFSYRAAQKAGVIDSKTSAEEFYKNAKEGNGYVTYNGKTVYYKANGNGQYQVMNVK